LTQSNPRPDREKRFIHPKMIRLLTEGSSEFEPC
jgi:hypothetical protein